MLFIVETAKSFETASKDLEEVVEKDTMASSRTPNEHQRCDDSVNVKVVDCFKSNIPRCLRRAQLNGVSKGGEHPLWSRAGFIPRSRNARLIVFVELCAEHRKVSPSLLCLRGALRKELW
jgi:hypothetical protein